MENCFDFNGANVLITGGAGFIGSNLALTIQKEYPESKITIFDRFRCDDFFPSGNPTSLGHFKNLINFKGNVISGDLNSVEDLKFIENTKWDCIFHEAAISDTTVTNQQLMIQTNTNAFRFFIDLAIKNDAHLVYASSAGVYGNSEAPNIIGEGEKPENVYGFSKLMMDNIQRNLIKINPQLKLTGLRYFNVYGQGEYYKGKTASMILQLGLQLLKTRKIKLFKYGEQQRDFVFINDVVQANMKAIGRPSGVYNVGSGKARTFNDIISILSKKMEITPEVEFIDNPYTFYQNHTEADIQGTKDKLEYEPLWTLEDGINNYYEEIVQIFNNN